MPELAARAPLGALPPVLRRRNVELLKLAREVEPEAPTLAVDLLGIALHEASAASHAPAAPAGAWWQRLGRTLFDALEAHGRARARRETLALAARCASSQPELARALRAACSRDA